MWEELEIGGAARGAGEVRGFEGEDAVCDGGERDGDGGEVEGVAAGEDLAGWAEEGEGGGRGRDGVDLLGVGEGVGWAGEPHSVAEFHGVCVCISGAILLSS